MVRSLAIHYIFIPQGVKGPMARSMAARYHFSPQQAKGPRYDAWLFTTLLFPKELRVLGHNL